MVKVLKSTATGPSWQFGQNSNGFLSYSVLLTSEFPQGKEELRHNHSMAIVNHEVFQVIPEADIFQHI